MTTPPPRIVCLGEMLIDFVSTESGVTLAQAPAFKKAPGGAPANVAVGLARLGNHAAFMGKVGDDDFGHFLAHTLQENGVDTGPLRFSAEARTALAFVSLRADGEREFMFYRHPSADMLFRHEEVDAAALQAADAFHFGSITLIDEPVRGATLHAVEVARGSGALVSYDPNLRLALWPDAKQARTGMLIGVPFAHVLKVSREELSFLTGEEDLQAGAAALWHDEMRVMLVTDGAHGSLAITPGFTITVPTFSVKTVDTTGAGDGFVAGFLHRLLQNPDLLNDEDALRAAVRFANAVGALTTTERGAIPALPTPEAVAALLDSKSDAG